MYPLGPGGICLDNKYCVLILSYFHKVPLLKKKAKLLNAEAVI
jgi:hypothetical protein